MFEKQKKEIFGGLHKTVAHIIQEKDISIKDEKLKKLKRAFLEIELDLSLNNGIETLRRLMKEFGLK